jgi:hypothetical protein
MEETVSELKLKGLRFQYWFTIALAVPLGAGIIMFPELTKKLFNLKEQDHIVFGITGSVYLAFGALSVLGLKEPVKWSPILLLQFIYKVTWMVGVVLFLAVRGELEIKHAIWLILGYGAMIAGDVWAVPWKHLLSGAE